MSREMRELELKKSVTFRGQRMSKASRRYAASNGSAISGAPASRPGAVRGSKPSTARLRKAGVVVPRKANAKRAGVLARKRGRLVKKKPWLASGELARMNDARRTIRAHS